MIPTSISSVQSSDSFQDKLRGRLQQEGGEESQEEEGRRGGRGGRARRREEVHQVRPREDELRRAPAQV